MKTKIIITLLLFSTIITSFAKQIDSTTAKQVGMRFLKSKTNSLITENENNLKLEYLAKSKGTANSKLNYFYIFNLNSVGFVIVSADDIVIPILGYSTTCKFSATDIPENTEKWLEGYVNQIRFAIENNLEANDEINAAWDELINNNSNIKVQARAGSVSPLITTKWNQSPYYNSLCPYDKQYGQNAVTGCVATAMAQIMKYWNYPTMGSGFHSYNHDKYGTISANFGSTTYQWNSMPNNVTSTNNAVATLMYHCGVSVDMVYGVSSLGGSSAKTLDVADALVKYFNYPSTIQGLYRVNYSDAQWKTLLKGELDAKRPIQYAGTGSGGGHSFVCDGYDNNDYFHFNWGWGGSSDGYFNMNALNPGSLGTGGGTGGFNTNQRAIIGIKAPSNNSTTNLALYADIIPSFYSINYGASFNIETNIVNKGTNTFNGDYCAAVFDNSGNFVDYIEIKTGYSLQSGYVYSNNLNFSTNGILGMLPGKFYVGIFYRTTGGNWQIVSDNGAYTNLIEINIVNPNDIELNSAIAISPSNELTKGQSASVNFNIVNDGSSTFYGQYQANLYDLDGTFIQTINSISENNGLPSTYTYLSPYITLNTNAITAEPGTYLLAILHKPTGSSNWQITGSTYFQNPIKVIVKLPTISPDKYEQNNTVSQSFKLPLTFSGNNAVLNTVGSNCHTGSDYDYYKIDLPSGCNYSILPRIHDSYSSGNGNSYTLDALFSYSFDGINWSDAYDDIIQNNIQTTGGSQLFFHVAPFFSGFTGTYLLDIKITRTSTASIDESDLTKLANLFPNPTNGEVTVAFNSTNEIIGDINLLNIQGQLISKIPHLKKQEEVSFSMAQYPSGVYFVQIQLANGSITKKLILNK
jgi:hypothetical protein